MSLFLDQKYLLLISNRLPLFKRKNDTVYNCRCILCGDSLKKKSKARGYFFAYKTELRYKCHNCDASFTFGNFLKKLDNNIFNQYSLEKYSEGKNVKLNNTFQPEFEEPVFEPKEKRLLDTLLDRLDTLDDENEAVQYCLARKIPRSKFDRLYYIDNIKNVVQLNEDYKESIKGEEPRLVIPFFNENGDLTGLTCRGLRGEALRYITVKVKDNVPLLFGLDEIDKTKEVYIVEGPIDSLFIENSIAIGGTGFNKSLSLPVPSEKCVYIYDNQPRNVELCKLIERSIDQGHRVVIWPQSLVEKDINEMVLASKNVKNIIKDNTFSGLAAKVKFYAWKRV